MANLYTDKGRHMTYLTGDPAELGNEVTRMKNVASTIDKLTEMLGNINSSSSSQSQKIDELREAAGEARDALSKARKLYNNTGWALGEYQQQLQTSQTDAKAATDDAQAIVGSVTASEESVQTARTAQSQAVDAPLPTGEGELDAHTRDLEQKSTAVTTATTTRNRLQGELDGYKTKWDKAKDDLDQAAETARGRIQGVADDNPAKDSWWDNLAGFLEGLQNILGWVALALAVVALFLTGPLALVLFAVATAITAVTLLINATLAVSGKKGWGDAIMSAVGLIPFGKFFGKGLSVATRFKNVGTGFVDNVRFVKKVGDAYKARSAINAALKRYTLSNAGNTMPRQVKQVATALDNAHASSRVLNLWNTAKSGGSLINARNAAIMENFPSKSTVGIVEAREAARALVSEPSTATGIETVIKKVYAGKGEAQQVFGWMTSDPPTASDLKARVQDADYLVPAAPTANPYAPTR